MSSWQRLEWAVVGADLLEGPEARVADPLWLLGRQWQVGELTGDDAGSPLAIEVDLHTTPVTRYQSGAPGERNPVVPLHGLGMPLETAVEAERVRSGATAVRLAAEAGLHLFRLLADEGLAPEVRDELRAAYPLAMPADDRLDPVGRAQLSLLVGRSLDARDLHADPAPPAPLHGGAGARALRSWTAWYESVFAEADTSAWQSGRMEYRFRVAASPSPDDEVVLDAPEYVGGRLDWHTFDVATGPSLEPPPERRERTMQVLPARASYAGQAASRWWELEDAATWFGDLHDAPEDLPRLALGAFGLTFGDDWYRVPCRVTVGNLVRVDRVRIRDSFGVVHRIRSCAELDGPERVWRFFELTGDPSADAPDLEDRTCPWLYLAPAVPGVVEGEPIEEVSLLRDEIANVGWAAERVIESRAGRAADRAAHARAAWSPPTARPGPAWMYRLAGPIPAHLVPLLPVEVDGDEGLFLQRGRLAVDVEDGDTQSRGAVGRVLESDRQLLVEDAEVPASGVTISRSWQMGRTRDGSVVTWLGRRKGIARPQTTPGTVFDEVDRREA